MVVPLHFAFPCYPIAGFHDMTDTQDMASHPAAFMDAGQLLHVVLARNDMLYTAHPLFCICATLLIACPFGTVSHLATHHGQRAMASVG